MQEELGSSPSEQLLIAIDNDYWAYKLSASIVDWLEMGEDILYVFDRFGYAYDLVETRKGLLAIRSGLDKSTAYSYLQRFYQVHSARLEIAENSRDLGDLSFEDLWRLVPQVG
jgi:hypothetical protein